MLEHILIALPSELPAVHAWPEEISFVFKLTQRDYLWLKASAQVSPIGSAIASLYLYLNAVACDEQGLMTEPYDNTNSNQFLCWIWKSDFNSIRQACRDLSTGLFDERLGETKLIPILHEMLHYEES